MHRSNESVTASASIRISQSGRGRRRDAIRYAQLSFGFKWLHNARNLQSDGYPWRIVRVRDVVVDSVYRMRARVRFAERSGAAALRRVCGITDDYDLYLLHAIASMGDDMDD